MTQGGHSENCTANSESRPDSSRDRGNTFTHFKVGVIIFESPSFGVNRVIIYV